MAAQKRSNRAFGIYITVLVILLVMAIALFVYGCMANGLPRPELPGNRWYALGAVLHHA